jgi:Hypothetical glycosyl hydrolase family 15
MGVKGSARKAPVGVSFLVGITAFRCFRVRLFHAQQREVWWRRRRPLGILAIAVAALAPAAAGPGGALADVYAGSGPGVALIGNVSQIGAGSFPNTDTGIHLGLAFDYRTQDATGVSSNVDYIWGGYFSDWDFGFYPSVPHTDGYVPFDTDAYPQNVPGHSLAWYQANHPDWVVYQCDGKTPAYYGSESNVPLDFSNPQVQAYEFQEAAQLLEQGASGIGFDDFTFTNYENRCGVYTNGAWTTLGYPGLNQGNAKLDSDMMDWLRNMRGMLTQAFPGKSLTVNMTPSLSGLGNVEQVAPYVDMALDEAGFTDWGQGNISYSDWQTEIDFFDYLNSQGKAFFVNAIVPAPDDADVTRSQLNWALANYLLVKGSYSYTYVYAHGADSGGGSGYGTFYDRPEYHASIGAPTSGMYQWQDVYVRNYSGGLVIVNPPGAQTVTVELNQPSVDLYGASQRWVTLAPTSGIILLTPAVPGGWPARAHAAVGRAAGGVKDSLGIRCAAAGPARHPTARRSGKHSTRPRPKRRNFKATRRTRKPPRHATTACRKVSQAPRRDRSGRRKGNVRSTTG